MHGCRSNCVQVQLTQKEIQMLLWHVKYLCVCQLLPVEVCAIYGRPLGVYLCKNPHSDRPHARRAARCQTWSKNRRLLWHFSQPVRGMSQSGLVSPCTHGGLPKKEKDSVNKSQHMPRYLVWKSCFRKKPSRFPTENSRCVDFL